MARVFTTNSRDEKVYVPRDFIDEKGKPEKDALSIRFIPLSKRQLALFQDASSRMSIASSTIILGNASVNIDVFKEAVIGWDNFIVDGAKVEFKKDASGKVHEEVLEQFPLDIIEEVANHIAKVSKFPEEEKGK